MFYPHKMWYLVVSKKKNPLYLCEDGIEKSIPRDHRLSSLGKPRDANRRSSQYIFLSYPYTQDGPFYSNTDNQRQTHKSKNVDKEKQLDFSSSARQLSL